jgi:hypothetical protein
MSGTGIFFILEVAKHFTKYDNYEMKELVSSVRKQKIT